MSQAVLTDRQSKFVQEFLACGNATASAIRAGFSPKGAAVTGTRLLRKANVQQALQAQQRADAARLSLSRQDVIRGLLEAADMAREQQNPMALIAAAREIGRLLGFYQPERVKVDLNVAGRVEMGRLSDAELLKIVEAG